jgi:hypothetical protein
LFSERSSFRVSDERLHDELTILDQKCQYLYCTEYNSLVSDERLRNELTLLDREVTELGCILTVIVSLQGGVSQSQ